MTTTTKPSYSDRFKDELSDSKFRRNPILFFILASMLVHGIGLIVFTLIKRSQPRVQVVPKTAPIDFVVVPPEESSSTTATNPLPKEETQPKKVIEPAPKPESAPVPTPEPPTPEKIEPIAPSPTVAVPEQVPESVPTETKPPEETKPDIPPQPQPVKPSPTVAVPEQVPESVPTETKPPEETKPDIPPQPQLAAPLPPSNIPAENKNFSEILSGSDTAIEEIETKTPETTESARPPADVTQPENTSVATSLPPKITPTQPWETDKPVSPNQELPATPPPSENQTPTDSGAASLLGGSYKRSLEDDGGDSFFDLQANASQQAYNPALLDPQQNIDMRKYFSEIQRRVRRNWNPGSPMEEYTTVLSFSIQRNGQITGLQVRQTSGSQEIDREALEAVQNSAPFDPLPANFPLDNVNVQFNFNIYIY